jgi:methylglyoxal synthase
LRSDKSTKHSHNKPLLNRLERVNPMNIALIAHDIKKELMANFCLAYKNILKEHHLFATGTTGSIIVESTKLEVHLLANGPLGEQQIIARIAYNEIDLVLFFRDFQSVRRDREEAKLMMQLCDTNNIPLATNIATAELLIHSLQRGELDFRKSKPTEEDHHEME